MERKGNLVRSKFNGKTFDTVKYFMADGFSVASFVFAELPVQTAVESTSISVIFLPISFYIQNSDEVLSARKGYSGLYTVITSCTNITSLAQTEEEKWPSRTNTNISIN